MILHPFFLLLLALLANTEKVSLNKKKVPNRYRNDSNNTDKDVIIENISIFEFGDPKLQNGWNQISSNKATNFNHGLIIIELEPNEEFSFKNEGIKSKRGRLDLEVKLSNENGQLEIYSINESDSGDTEYSYHGALSYSSSGSNNGFVSGKVEIINNESSYNLNKFALRYIVEKKNEDSTGEFSRNLNKKIVLTIKQMSYNDIRVINNEDNSNNENDYTKIAAFDENGDGYWEDQNNYNGENQNNDDTSTSKPKELPECPDFTTDSCNGGNPIKYCLKSNGNNGDQLIYGIDETGKCSSIDSGVYVFSVNENETEKSASLVVTNSTDLIEDSLIMYQCVFTEDINKCVKTSGFIIVNSNYYAIPSDKGISTKINIGSLKSDCYKYNGISSIGNLMNYYGQIGICYDESSYSIIKFPNSKNENKNYLLIDNINTSYRKIMKGPFYGINTSKKTDSGISITSLYAIDNKNPTMIYFNRFFKITNYCYYYGEFLSRKDYLCKYNGTSCSYYYCTDGICKRSDNTCPGMNENACLPNDNDGQSNCNDGYYVVTRDTNNDKYTLASSDIQNGYLYYCKNRSCVERSMYGFFENSDNQMNTNYPYIKCIYSNNSGKLCTLIQNPNSTKCNFAGDLIKNRDNQSIVEVCISSTESKPLVSENVGFIYTNVEVISPNYSNNIVLMLDKNSIHTISNYDEHNNYIGNQYFLINESSKKIVTQSGENGRIYYCEGLSCYTYSDIIGYIFNTPRRYDSNALPFIQCSGNNNCIIIDVTKTTCNSSGELFKTNNVNDNDIYNICLDTTTEQAISLEMKDRYEFITESSKYSTSNIYVMVSTDTPNIFGNKVNAYVVAEMEHNNIKYISYGDFYKYSLDRNIVLNSDMLNNNCAKSKITEFELICPYDGDYDREKSYYRKTENEEEDYYFDDDDYNNSEDETGRDY